jgi:hypothetical protein
VEPSIYPSGDAPTSDSILTASSFRRHTLSRLPTAEGLHLADDLGTTGSATSTWISRGVDGGRKLYLFVPNRVRKFAVAELHERATPRIAADFLRQLIERIGYRIHTVSDR